MNKLLLAIASLGFASAAQAQVAITVVQDSVKSENTSGKTSTTGTFTSPPVIVTIEQRYVDRTRIYKLGGSQIQPSTTTTNLCTANYTPCTSGQTLTGVRIKANLGQLGNGQEFFYQSTNAYSP